MNNYGYASKVEREYLMCHESCVMCWSAESGGAPMPRRVEGGESGALGQHLARTCSRCPQARALPPSATDRATRPVIGLPDATAAVFWAGWASRPGARLVTRSNSARTRGVTAKALPGGAATRIPSPEGAPKPRNRESLGIGQRYRSDNCKTICGFVQPTIDKLRRNYAEQDSSLYGFQ